VRSHADLPVAGAVVIVRADLNVPLTSGPDGPEVADDARLRASIPTLRSLAERGARVVVLAHLGRPSVGGEPGLSLAVVAGALGVLLGRPVGFVPAVSGPAVAAAVADLAPGGVLVCENVRFDDREASSDPAARAALAAEWAALADAYVLDGFGVAHREQASVTDLPALLPHAAGECVLAEVSAFRRILDDPARPYAVILGGAKVSDKLGVVGNLLPRVDSLLIGGGMAFTFLMAQGCSVGSSLVETNRLGQVRELLARAQDLGVEILLPEDLVIARDLTGEGPIDTVPAAGIPEGWMGLDIGPATRARFAAACEGASTIVWNGPLGVAEVAAFAGGTCAVAAAVAAATGRGAFTVIGGGDTAAAVHACGHADRDFAHVSTGGGASLELLEGIELPGLRSLAEDDRAA